MRPYYDEAGITIYCGDSREVLDAAVVGADVGLMDPPFGVGLEYGYGSDSEEYVRDVCVEIVRKAIRQCTRVVVTTGYRCAFFYPRPDTMWCLHWPNGSGRGRWSAFNCWQPVLCYGSGPKRRGSIPDTFVATERSRANGHPCPKPLAIWTKLLRAVTDESDHVVLDPFMGSGTTLRAAKNLGLRAIGIDVDEHYCEIAARRLQQEVLPLEVSDAAP